VHHPYESFSSSVEAFLEAAANDPQVLAIKLTLYRTSGDTAIVRALTEAAEAGKQVAVLIELQARFDEQNNIEWARKLEKAGVHVVYGLVGLKTHCKLALVVRQEKNGELKYYSHVGTGNYNPKTARLYTDLGYLSADPDLTADADTVFRQLASLSKFKAPKRLLLAPFNLHSRMLELLGRVAAAARAGYPARVVLKINALTDAELIQGLIAAGQAGARIDLIVRGACMLPPGLPGVSDNILVRSVVGRFLEHSRISYFRWGEGEEEEALYLSSADWMNRNMLRRIEIAWPVRDAALRQRVIDECLVPYLHDGRDAWVLESDGRYRRAGEDGLSAQQALVARHG